MQIANATKADRSGTELAASANANPTRDLIDALMRPEAYEHVQGLENSGPVSFLQTHISLLFFVGGESGGPLGRVYKVKKPVDLGFLDYTTIEARRHFCFEEVRLNRRLAGDVYLGVRPIVRDRGGGIRIGDESDGEVLDYAVEMVRLPAERMLSALLDRGEIDNASLNGLVQLLAEFHRRCPTGAGVDEHASPTSIRQQVHETIEHLKPFAGSVVSQRLLDALRTWFDRFLRENEPLLLTRIADGRIREGHGDLHSENICMMHDRIVVYDCIEFTPRFRCRDVACEIAFLAMEFDARGFRGFSNYLTHRYAAQTQDDDLHRVLPLYKVYLALVRAKVAALKSAGNNINDAERGEAQVQASRYALLAGSYLVEPALVIMCGLPGSGKSWTARAIARPFEAVVLRSDVIRKRLAGLQAHEDASRIKPEVYSASFTKRTYAAMLKQARSAITAGRSVVADATFATAALRGPFIALARETRLPWVVAHTHAPDEEIRQRMQRRKADATEVSDADWFVYEQARSRWHDLTEIDAARVASIGPGLSPEEAAAIALDGLLHDSR